MSRNVAFISALMERKVEFVACDNPHANKLTIHIFAAIAEHERDMIADRTRKALAAAKARGVKLGNYARISKAKQEATSARGGISARHRLDHASVGSGRRQRS